MPSGFDPSGYISRYRQLSDQARAANEKRYQELLDLSDRRQQLGGYQMDRTGDVLQNRSRNVMSLLEGSGTSARRRVRQGTAEAKASDSQSLISRGLFNSTVLDSLSRQRDRDAEDQYQSIDEAVRTQQAGALERTQGDLADFMFRRAQFQTGLLGDRQGIIERRSDVGPDEGALMQLLMQYGYGSGRYAGESSGPRLHATIGAGGSRSGGFSGTSAGDSGGGTDPFGATKGSKRAGGVTTHTNPQGSHGTWVGSYEYRMGQKSGLPGYWKSVWEKRMRRGG